MNCPGCGSDQCFVVDVRTHEKGNIKRHRECMFCGERFNTIEINMEEFKSYKDLKLKLLRWEKE